MGFFSKLKEGLEKTRHNIAQSIAAVFSGSEIRSELYEELEEALIMADVGMGTSEAIITDLKARVKEQKLTTNEQAKEALKGILVEYMNWEDPFIGEEKAVILVVGVNGVGKTTSIGKLASLYKGMGKKVLLGAGDTFRAAATEQLALWAGRAGVDIIKQGEGADPAAVVFDAVNAAKARNTDVLIIDTAGRLHNKKNLMEELKKIRRVLDREYTDVRVEVLLVLDSTTGQNAISQAKVFAQTVQLTGIILTKLDGTAKGGVVLAVKHELDIPVRFIGVGEAIDDLQPFDAQDFAEALLPKE